MNAIVKIRLSEAGRKLQILASQDASEIQSITLEPSDALFASVVNAGVIGKDSVVLDVSGWQHPDYDYVPTVQAVLDGIAQRAAAKDAEEAARKAKTRQSTLEALAARKTSIRQNYASAGDGRAVYEEQVAVWPYPSDSEVCASPEAQAWLEEISASNALARAAAQQAAEADRDAKAAAKKLAEEREQARRQELHLRSGDLDLDIEDGALTEVPSGCWESHKRGKNWMAVISVSPSSPGGLARDFADKAKGASYYIVPHLDIGDAIEFGADYYSGGGSKSARRWYGYVVRVDSEDGKMVRLVVRQCDAGKQAVKEGEKYAKQAAKQEVVAS